MILYLKTLKFYPFKLFQAVPVTNIENRPLHAEEALICRISSFLI
jgi:hypothetical protein